MTWGGQSMTTTLRRALVCAPDAAGWSMPERAGAWRALGYEGAPSGSGAAREHAALCAALADAGVELARLDASPAHHLDAVYTHDPSILTDRGAIILKMGKAARAGEPGTHAAFYRAAGIPILGSIAEPGTVEGGDLVWLDEATLLAGHGYRTNAAGIEQLRALLAPAAVEVIAAPLPHGRGPDACLHLMSLMSLLDAGTAVVDLPWLAVPTLERLRGRGLHLVPIDPAERDALACNVLALGGRRLLAMEGSPNTQARLRDAGFDVRTFPGHELGRKGGGGPTCLTRPLFRAG
jgi:N-dimethylarginine dimethylaminohydrolase